VTPTYSQDLGNVAFAPVYAHGTLWLILGGDIRPINPASLAFEDTLNVPGSATSLAVGNGALWAVDPGGHLKRFGTDGAIQASVAVGKGLSAVAAGEGATWVAVSSKR
jgi:hypothetical protein